LLKAKFSHLLNTLHLGVFIFLFLYLSHMYRTFVQCKLYYWFRWYMFIHKIELLCCFIASYKITFLHWQWNRSIVQNIWHSWDAWFLCFHHRGKQLSIIGFGFSWNCMCSRSRSSVMYQLYYYSFFFLYYF